MSSLEDLRLDLANKAETYVTTNLPGLWKAVQERPKVHRAVNAALIDRAILKIPTRPNPLSTRSPYSSWAPLPDRPYDSRPLPPEQETREPPDAERVARLFN